MGERPLEGLRIGVSLHCRGCGYELRGLPAEGPCPECGLDRLESLRHAVDPATSRLPKLNNPRKVGNALVWLVSCQFLMVLTFVVGPAVMGVESLRGRPLAIGLPPWIDWIAVVFALTALWSVIAFWTPGDDDARAIRRDLIRIGAGQIALGALLYGWWNVSHTPTLPRLSDRWLTVLPHALAIIMPAVLIVVYTGMGGVLNTIGRRSRVFRTSQGSRQRVRDLNAALIGTMIGVSLSLTALLVDIELLVVVGRMLIAISVAMLLLGQGYLVVNAVWIRRALRQPPPTLDEVLVRNAEK